MGRLFFYTLATILCCCSCTSNQQVRQTSDFTLNWKFMLGDEPQAFTAGFNDESWRTLDLPHDWSIEGTFSADHPARPNGGALPGGTGWYRKTFEIPASEKGKCVFIDFDGVYWNSTVWINGELVGNRPNGYISFRYDLTPYIRFGEKNVIAVKVDNSQQPNSRWYSGSGIYRNVWLTVTNPVHIAGTLTLSASSEGLQSSEIKIKSY